MRAALLTISGGPNDLGPPSQAPNAGEISIGVSMYQNAALLALFLLVYSAVAGRVERSWVSGPIVFTSVGLLLGPVGLNILHLNITAEGLRILAELTLAMVLFTDAANADLGTVRHTPICLGAFC